MKYVTVYLFKVGDKLRCIKRIGHLQDQQLYTFSNISSDGGVELVEFPTRSYKTERFEKVPNEIKQ